MNKIVMTTRWITCLKLFCILGILTACSGTPSPTDAALTPVTVQLRWTHNAQFAGFYAADVQGYYAFEGLSVDFIEGGPDVDLFKAPLDGSAQFGIHGADAVLAERARGQPVQAISAIYRRSPTVFISLANSGITRPQDFAGKTIQVGRGSGKLVLHAITAQVGIRPDQYTEVPLTADLAPLYDGQVQVVSGFLMDQPLRIANDGYAVNLIYPDDYGVHFFGDTLWASDDFIAGNPDVVLRFLSATLKGWTYAVENPAQVPALVQKYNPDADPDLELKIMTASIPLINTGEDFIGWMKPEIWAGMEKTLREQGVLTAPLDVTQVYTLQFLEEIYK